MRSYQDWPYFGDAADATEPKDVDLCDVQDADVKGCKDEDDIKEAYERDAHIVV